jgi:mRNA interferase MazF
MTRFEFGDVVLVPFLFTDQSSSKKRPAVIVSAAIYNAERPDVVVMAVTSQVHTENRFDIPIHDWQQAKLLKPSVVKPVIATIEKTLVIRQLGRLSVKDRQSLAESFRTILG